MSVVGGGLQNRKSTLGSAETRGASKCVDDDSDVIINLVLRL